MKRFNYFDDAGDSVERSKPNGVKDLFAICTRPIETGLEDIKKRRQNGEPLSEILFKKPEHKTILVRFSVAAICIIVLVLTISIPAAAINKNTKKENAFRRDAGAACSSLISEYGTGKAEIISDSSYALTGLSYVRQVDFDNDSKYELLAVYESGGEYFIEVWGYVKDEFSQIFSSPANVAENAELGAWVSLYNSRGKYYVGVLSDDGVTMKLWAKSGSKFKEKKECRYDAEEDIYAIDDKVDKRDFETIRLSYLSGTDAQKIIDSVSSVIDQFVLSDVSADEESAELSEKKLYGLYADTVSSLEAQYGEAEYESSAGLHSAKGVCVVRLVDFNGDETPELLVVFSYDKSVLSTYANGDAVTVTEPDYKLRVYAEKNGSVKMIYETDALTGFQGSDTQRFYILQKSGSKTNLCNNTYSYSSTSTRVWKATSRIRALSDSLKFETTFTAVANCSWGYMSYSIDGDVVYSAEFAEKGYQVPYFCTDTANYDEEEFTVGFVRGNDSYAENVKATVDETKAQIKELSEAK